MRRTRTMLAAPTVLAIAGCGAMSDPRETAEQANRQLIQAYYAEPSEIRRLGFFSENYRQHNPAVADGKDALRAGFAAIHEEYPKLSQNVKRIAADGDLVWVHLHTIPSPGDRGLAVINIFRIEQGKIAEHWEVVQPVPEKSANNNTMF